MTIEIIIGCTPWFCIVCFYLTDVKSAFTVLSPLAGLSSGSVMFTQEITNIGGHYSYSTGIFTCEFPGIYVFELHIMKSPGSEYASCYIRKNEIGVVSAFTNPDSDSDVGMYGSTNSVVFHLIQGDTVDVGFCSPMASIYMIGGDYAYTTFSGFMLKAD